MLAADTYTLTIGSRLSGLPDLFTNGDTYRLTFGVAPGTTPILSIGEFARGPGQAINLPASDPAAGIPVRITNGATVSEVTFTLRYHPDLLVVQDISLAGPATGNLTLKSIDPLAGVAMVRVEQLAGLTNASTVLLSVRAQVPGSAPYGTEHVLDIDDLQLNAGALAGRDDDGLHLVAKLGEASGDGAYSSSDALLIQRVIVRLDNGFSAYPLTDPVVLGDVNANGRLDASDALLVQYKAEGKVVSQLPD